MPTSVSRVVTRLVRKGFAVIYNSFHTPDIIYGLVILKRKDVLYTILNMISGITILYQSKEEPYKVLAEGRTSFSEEELEMLFELYL